jgi:group I intron endonuclease
VNLTNRKSYVGSSVNLGRRLKNYFNINFISDKLRGKSLINAALLKYGYSNFSLEILEYCEPTAAIKREQYYIDLLEPQYNILKKANSFLGFKHSEESLRKRPYLNLHWRKKKR